MAGQSVSLTYSPVCYSPACGIYMQWARGMILTAPLQLFNNSCLCKKVFWLHELPLSSTGDSEGFCRQMKKSLRNVSFSFLLKDKFPATPPNVMDSKC